MRTVRNALRSPAGACSPAVCYHAYAQLAQRQLSSPVMLTARGRCFRAERETSAGVRQVEFEMREIVLLGPREWIEGAADEAPLQSRHLQVSSVSTVSGRPPPIHSSACGGWEGADAAPAKTEIEYQWPHADGLALASINRHGTFFGTRFSIADRYGDPVHTMCVAVGLDRWAHHACASTSATRERPVGCTSEVTR